MSAHGFLQYISSFTWLQNWKIFSKLPWKMKPSINTDGKTIFSKTLLISQPLSCCAKRKYLIIHSSNHILLSSPISQWISIGQYLNMFFPSALIQSLQVRMIHIIWSTSQLQLFTTSFQNTWLSSIKPSCQKFCHRAPLLTATNILSKGETSPS